MYGISSSGKEALAQSIEQMFDRIALQFIGDIPRLRNKKRLIISTEPHFGLSHLFVQSMTNRVPNIVEKDVLKSLLESSNGYIDSLKSKTMASVVERIDGLAREAQMQNRKLSQEEVQIVLDEELTRAKHGLTTIAEAESTKLRNLGAMMQISNVASSIGDEDPTVFFAVIKDATTCKECLRLHLMPDQSTPRLWKLSELKYSYHKRGEQKPSIGGLHPFCRCTLVYLTDGFGFDKSGKLTFIDSEFDAYSNQRK